MSQLRVDFFNETGVEWENSQGEPDIDYVNWLEAKVEKFTTTNNAMDAIRRLYERWIAEVCEDTGQASDIEAFVAWADEQHQ